MKEFLNILKHNFLFTGIEGKELEGLLASLHPRERKYKRGDFILNRGDKVKNIGIVIKGAVSIIKEDIRGIRSIIARCGPGEVFAEALACAQISASPVSVSAAEDCTILNIAFKDITDFEHTGKARIKLLKNMLSLLAHKNVFLNSKLEHLSKRSIREKLLSYFATMQLQSGGDTFTLPLSKTDLADFLFIDRSAMGRELTLMRRKKLIDFKGRQIKLNKKGLF